VIGDPGNGKSRLMQEIAKKGDNTLYVDLKKLQEKSITSFFEDKQIKETPKEDLDNIERTGYFYKEGFKLINSDKLTICLDALDEISEENLSAFRTNICDFFNEYNECSIIISCRTHNLKYLQEILPNDLSVVQIRKFNIQQVQEILKDTIKTISDQQINSLLKSTTKGSFNPLYFHENILQTPRYLLIAIDLIKNNEIKDYKNLSQFELFELFIKNKLKKEKELEAFDLTFAYKFLCLLALIMEIKQVNQITKDEFNTILDDVKSDIKLFVFGKITTDTFFKHTVLKDTDNIVQFENREFQEYLAACEIISLDSTEQAIYDLCYIPEIKALNFSWYNTLSFIFDQRPELVLNIVLRHSADKTISHNLIEFILSNINERNLAGINEKARELLFKNIFIFFGSNHFIPHQHIFNLANLYVGNGTDLLAVLQSPSPSKIVVINVLRLFLQLYDIGVIIDDSKQWEKTIYKICYWNKDDKEYIEYTLPALASFNKRKYVDRYDYYLKDISNSKHPFIDSYFHALISLGNNDLILKYLLLFYRTSYFSFTGVIHAVNYLLKSEDGLSSFVKEICNDGDILINFLDSINYKTLKIENTIEKIGENDELLESIESLILTLISDTKFLSKYLALNFILDISKYLVKYKKKFAEELLDRINNNKTERNRLIYQLTSYFPYIISVENLNTFSLKIKRFFDAFYFENIIRNCEVINPDVFAFANQKIKKGQRVKNIKAFIKEIPYKLKSYFVKESKSKQNEILNVFLGKLRFGENMHSSDVFSYYKDNYETIDKDIKHEDLVEFKRIIEFTLNNGKPENAKIEINSKSGNNRNFTTTSVPFLHAFNEISQIPNIKSFVDLKKYRKTLISYIPLNIHIDHIYVLLEPLEDSDIQELHDAFTRYNDDRVYLNTETFLSFVKKYNVKKALPYLKGMLNEPFKLSDFSPSEIVKTIAIFEDDAQYFIDLDKKIDKSTSYNLWDATNAVLISSFKNIQAIKDRCKELKNRKLDLEEPDFNFSPNSIARSISNEEAELNDYHFAHPIMHLQDTIAMESVYDLLDFSVMIYEHDKNLFKLYSDYIDEIVFKYFEGLKTKSSYEIISNLEFELEQILEKYESNRNYSRRIDLLKRSYSTYIETSKPLAEYIKKYNDQKTKRYLPIHSDEMLYQTLEKAIDEDLRNWVELEGAYKMIQHYKVRSGKRTIEDLMQKTMSSQLENILLKKELRGFDINREVEMLDGVRPDFLIKYGFIGPVMIEIKRSGNSDFADKDEKIIEYRDKLIGYLNKSKSKKGIYLIFNDKKKMKFKEKIYKHEVLYKNVPIKVIGIDCMNFKDD